MSEKYFSIEALNAVRMDASEEYQSRIPVATQNNIAEIGHIFETYTTLFNEYSTALFNKIGLTVISSQTFENPLKRFKTGSITSGQDVEDIWVDEFRTAEGQYDPTGVTVNPFARRNYQDVQVAYYRMNRQDKYVITINRDDHIRAFTNPSNLDGFYARQFNSLYTGSEYDEWVLMKQLLADAAKSGDMFTVYDCPNPSTDANAKKFIKAAKKVVKDMSYVTDKFNALSVKTKSKASELVLFINKDATTEINVELYSTIFGPQYAGFETQVVELDDFGDLNDGTFAMLVDKDWFKIWDTKHEMAQLFNPDNLATNYWLHIWQILSYSKFKNAVRFTTAKAPTE